MEERRVVARGRLDALHDVLGESGLGPAIDRKHGNLRGLTPGRTGFRGTARCRRPRPRLEKSTRPSETCPARRGVLCVNLPHKRCPASKNACCWFFANAISNIIETKGATAGQHALSSSGLTGGPFARAEMPGSQTPRGPSLPCQLRAVLRSSRRTTVGAGEESSRTTGAGRSARSCRTFHLTGGSLSSRQGSVQRPSNIPPQNCRPCLRRP